jgi:type VI secretion system protein VasJ
MTTVESPEDLERAMAQAREVLAGVTAYLRATDPGNPLIHRLPRYLLWAEIQQLPPDEDGVTAILQPAAEVREGIEAMAAAGDWDALLERTEEVFMSGALWLDLQRWAWEALTGKGEGFEAAADGVALETGALVRRFPDLLRLRFDGGEPLADDATRAWIQARALGGGGAIEVATAPTLGGRVRGGEGFEEAVQEARRLARSKKLGEALALLERGALGAGRLDDRIAWKLEVARACIAGEYHDLALAQLEAIEQELARSTVEQWDPELCADLLRQMLLARRRIWERVEPSAEEAARTRDLMARLTRLDLRAALELHGRG